MHRVLVTDRLWMGTDGGSAGRDDGVAPATDERGLAVLGPHETAGRGVEMVERLDGDDLGAVGDSCSSESWTGRPEPFDDHSLIFHRTNTTKSLVGSSMSWKIAGTNITGQGDPRWCGKRQRRRSNERDVGGDNQS